MYPIRFEPIYKDYAWGGNRIIRDFHRKVDKSHIAESWEISDRPEAMSIVANGPFKGKSLNELVREMGENLLGIGQKFDRFPLLLKIIDAKENLSVQVHPDEMTAERLKNAEGRTEVWVMLDEGSVYAGLNKAVTEKELRAAIKSGKIEKLIEKLELKRGDAVYVPGGRVHSIGGGSFLYQIQQNSNTTYRLFNWDRKDKDLNLEEGFASIHWQDQGHAKIPPHHLSSDFHHQIVTLATTPFFITERIDVFDHQHLAHIPKTFQIFFCMHGGGKITVDSHTEPFELGMTYLVPAACNSIEIDGKCEALRVRFP